MRNWREGLKSRCQTSTKLHFNTLTYLNFRILPMLIYSLVEQIGK